MRACWPLLMGQFLKSTVAKMEGPRRDLSTSTLLVTWHGQPHYLARPIDFRVECVVSECAAESVNCPGSATFNDPKIDSPHSIE